MTRNRALFLALLVAAIGGCTVYDDRQLSIAIVGSRAVANELRLRVDASPGFTQATLSIDGRDVRTSRVGQEVALDVSALDETDHTVEARVEGGRPPPPARTTFTVYRGPPMVVSVDPPPGPQPPGAFQVDVRFSCRIDALSSYGSYLMHDDGRLVRTTATILSDGLTVRLVALEPLDSVAPVVAEFNVLDSMRRWTLVDLGPWSLAQITVGFGVPDPNIETFTNGTVTVLPVASGFEASGIPQVAHLYANDALIAELGPPPWSAVAWDTRTMPEGPYALRVDVPGFFVHREGRPTVWVDRTPPVLSCEPTTGTAAEPAFGTCVELFPLEPLPDAPVHLRIDGTPIATIPDGGYIYPGVPVHFCPASSLPVPPFSLELDVSRLADRAGNAAIPNGCVYEVPAWRTTAGAAAIGAYDGPFLAAEVAIGGVGAPDMRLAWIPPTGAASAGDVVASTPFYGFLGNVPWWNVPSELSNLPSSGVALSGSRAVWAEGTAGTGQIASAVLVYLPSTWVRDPAGALNVDPSQDARRPAGAAHSGAGGLSELVAWSEADGAGGRAIQTKLKTSGAWTTVAGDVRASAGSVADEAAVAIENGSGPRIGALLAFVESGSVSPPQVRAATVDLAGTLAWSPLAGILNLDPAAAASEPTVLAGSPFVLAWAEGGQVLARTAADPFGAAGFGAPSVLNVDAAHAARSPRAAWNDRGAVVVFVEAAPSGDEIWARRWNGASWDLLPGPVNAGTAPGVRSLSVARGPLVAWVTDDGTIRIRLGNF